MNYKVNIKESVGWVEERNPTFHRIIESHLVLPNQHNRLGIGILGSAIAVRIIQN
ncbi:hypothetical protein [Scytonema sp. NUACC26]|uniref:hypothetical protein n=1 Tax=Scytonema sp. NUACC26 TaxID=3140176 RepID=UPI0034DC8666